MSEVEIQVRVEAPAGHAAISDDEARKVGRQLVADLVGGSFAPYGEWARSWKPSGTVTDVHSPEEGAYLLTLALPSSAFTVDSGGLQHLIGIVLSPEIRRTRLQEIALAEPRVVRISLPHELIAEHDSRFRPPETSVSSIREQFGLDADEPLLAFTFKPRFGLDFQAVRTATLRVLEAGFHIVELDTRNVEVVEPLLEQWTRLAREAAAIGKNHVTAFSPNLSFPSGRTLAMAREFDKAVPPDRPMAVKVDGGIDGITTAQALRHATLTQPNRPIITSYLLLRGVVPEDFMLEAMTLSGANIIYPGGRPNLPAGRQIDVAERGEITRSVIRYRRIVSDARFIPTIAGGVHLGQVHAFYCLFGPGASYFIGGGLACHKKDPAEAAALCVEILKECRRRARTADQEVGWGDDLSVGLRKHIEEDFTQSLPYLSPRDLLGVPTEDLYPWWWSGGAAE